MGPDPKPPGDRPAKMQVLVTVKAAPNPSETYGETVCVAGVRADVAHPGFVRLYPINFRDLDSDDRFGKYQIITLEATLAPFGVQLTYVAHTAHDGMHSADDLPHLLPQADIVVLLLPLTSQTRGMVNAAFLAAMPDGSLLVNAARGQVADTEALVKELSTGRIRAALDVTDPEPLPADHPLWDMPNVMYTPHIGGATRGVLPRAYRLVGDQVRRYTRC